MFKKFFWPLLAFYSANIFAQTEMTCPSFEDSQSVVKYIVENHPQVQYLGKVGDARNNAIDEAGQRPNPELDFQYDIGDSFGEKVHNTESSLKHTFELGGKRSARIKVATSQKELFQGSLREVQEKLKIRTILNLYELKQNKHLLEVYAEAIGTFKKIIRVHKRRKNLSPEDTVSLTTFELAANEYDLKKNELVTRIQELNAYFIVALGGSCELSTLKFPSEKKHWPELEVSFMESEKYSKLQKAHAALKLGDATYEKERSLSYPNLQVGPFLGSTVQGNDRNAAVGVAITIDLPILNLNSGGRARALSQKIAAEKNYQNTKMKVQVEKNQWRTIYSNAVKKIKDSLSFKYVESKHQNVEKLFKRGIISTPLVIESHRQLIDFTDSLQKQQLTALEALWNIYAIEGTIMDKTIQ